MRKREIKSVVLFITSAIASGVVGNLVTEKVISQKWTYLVYILSIVTFGIGVHGYITFTIPRYKKIFTWAKSVIFREPEMKEKPPEYRGKYKFSKRKKDKERFKRKL